VRINLLVLCAAWAWADSFAGGAQAMSAPAEIAPIQAPFPMPQLRRPVFPDRTFAITDFGAKGDRATKSTKAFADAIAACHAAGGGRVLVPAGQWLTGAIHIKSNVNLHMLEGAEIHFSDDPADYLPVVFTRWAGFEVMNYSPLIYANGCENIAITGPGRFYGHGEKWWPWRQSLDEGKVVFPGLQAKAERGTPAADRIYGVPDKGLRPQFISPINCRNVLLEGFTIAEAGPFWTIHLVYCENVIARGLTILTKQKPDGPPPPNTDGLNLDSSRNALVEYCFFDVGDDAICLKSGINDDGRRVGRPTENVVVRQVTTNWCLGGIVIGSEMSGGVRNVLVQDCVFDGSNTGIRLKSNAARGGVVENIHLRDITMHRIKTDAITLITNYASWGPAGDAARHPIFRNLIIENVTCDEAGRALIVEGTTHRRVENVTMRNVSLKAQKGMEFNWVNGLNLTDVACTPATGRPLLIRNSTGVKEAPVSPAYMMTRFLLGEAEQAWRDWQDAFEAVKTPEEIAAYQKRLRAFFLDKLGAFPKRTPLNARVTGTLRRAGYRVEKVLFESRPGFHVTGALFVPESPDWPGPYPGVLVPCGHALNAKAWDTYQSMGALLALNGMVALVFDPVDQGERIQLFKESGEMLMWGTKAHNMAGTAAILLGLNLATYEVWDGMRAIDYLQSRPEVDPERIGCTGNSGGGTQTALLMALDERIKAAAPSCYLHHRARQLENAIGDAEQQIHGQMGKLDHADFILMRAPVPVLICAATGDFFDIRAAWKTFRYAKRRYSAMGHGEKVDLLENDAPHNYDRLQRESVVRWMARWLQGRVATITEPELALFTEQELLCTPDGQVMRLPGERSIYELNEEFERDLAGPRAERVARMSPDELRAAVRATADIRPLASLPIPGVVEGGAESVTGGTIRRYTIHAEVGIQLPATLYLPATPAGNPLLLVNEDGQKAAAEEARRRMQAGQAVLTIDLRGTDAAESQQDYYRAYVLGRSYVGMRAEDLLVCARWLADRQGTATVALRARGNAGVPALHAAALEPKLFAELHMTRNLASWRHVIRQRPTQDQLINAIHGALRIYDLPDLAALLGDRITVADPVDAQGNPVAARGS
jgi:polygalacturonase/dienelactone hydrolase